MKKFENKVAIIVGGTSGIGKSTANDLLNEGAIVHIIGRSVDKVESLPNLVKHKSDITDSLQLDNLIAEINELKNVDYLVNASGIFGPKPFLEHTKEDYDSYLDLNRGFFFLTQATAKK